MNTKKEETALTWEEVKLPIQSGDELVDSDMLHSGPCCFMFNRTDIEVYKDAGSFFVYRAGHHNYVDPEDLSVMAYMTFPLKHPGNHPATFAADVLSMAEEIKQFTEICDSYVFSDTYETAKEKMVENLDEWEIYIPPHRITFKEWIKSLHSNWHMSLPIVKTLYDAVMAGLPDKDPNEGTKGLPYEESEEEL